MKRKNYAKKMPKRQSYDHLCPVCGQYTFTEPHDICPVCGWEQDSAQEREPFFAGGANAVSLNAARKKWKGEAK